jgi:membrane associated rhomboid family serine protease
MGIQDRDYYRDGSRSFLDTWNRQGVVITLIVVTCVAFFAQNVNSPPVFSPVTAFGAYNAVKIQEGEVWRLLTPLFLHASLWHLLLNMLTLYWAGSRVEELYGGREFLAFYLGAGLFTHTLSFLMYLVGIPSPVLVIGASGATIAVLVLTACHFPRMTVVFWVVPMPLWVLVLVYVGLNVVGSLNWIGGGIAYGVHLGGMLFAFLYYQTGFRFHSLGLGRSRVARPARARPTLRVVPAPNDETPHPAPVVAERVPEPKPQPPADDASEARVDQILAKVSKHGEGSLTPEEREILVRASERYKKRRK